MEIIPKYFPEISNELLDRFQYMEQLYKEWNGKINVISRKDIDNFEVNHLLHSLSIAKFIRFKEESKILDLGTGGGLPGLPLAMMFPDSNFHLIDRVGKKIKVAEEIASELDIMNVTFQHGDLGECHDKFDFIVNRGVMPQPDIARITRKNISNQQKNALPNGIISLKGGDLSQEISTLRNRTEIVDLNQFFKEPFFDNKKIVYTSV